MEDDIYVMFVNRIYEEIKYRTKLGIANRRVEDITDKISILDINHIIMLNSILALVSMKNVILKKIENNEIPDFLKINGIKN